MDELMILKVDIASFSVNMKDCTYYKGQINRKKFRYTKTSSGTYILQTT